ncbi:CBS domain-containing protein [Desulfobotulus sp. H1]|uniref:CBS domain-containing protein n=1 Tax=Desulfobotulus pelophilus TaxID=2823377 RepID=A0ABT3N9R0_9BACT|nr:CBS domain-containing protein [Desulfobotulus pelophilus]MCW7754196.1 CBS domain-containing protein [Desulfobotulus pelophilus]
MQPTSPLRSEAVVHTLITTHKNADLDGIASMLAAKKLYPEARIVLPGSDSPQFRHFFVQSLLYLFDLIPFREVQPETIKTLVIVDTRQKDRIGELASLTQSQDIALHIYDHHPPAPGDLRGQIHVCGETGATVSLMVPLLIQHSIRLTPEEATLLAMGIYEDTGHLTSNSTTAEDFESLAWLMRQGAHLPTVGDVLTRELDPEQVRLLNEMLDSATEMSVHGTPLTLTRLSRETYVPDLAFLVHHFMRMEKISVLFLMARMDGKIHLIGRSRLPDMNMGALMQHFEGGGHTAAGAATIRSQTLAQVETRLLRLLDTYMPRRFQALEIMSTPAHTIGPTVSFRSASQTMTRYNVNALLVTEKGDTQSLLLGLITRQIVEQGLSHAMDTTLVQDYLISEVETVPPDAPLHLIQDAIVGGKQRVLPVMDPRHGIVGVITRTDLLQLMVKEQEETPSAKDVIPTDHQPRTRDIINLMRERLPSKILALLADIGKSADQSGCNAFVVGGFVRDLLLYRKNEDIDIVVEGDGILFAKAFAATRQARVHAYSKFGTAVITLDDGFKVDVATARTEYYTAPAALPEVEKSSLKADLYRRDFTINTLAIQLNQSRYGTLIDHFAGQKDIKDKTLRIIHNLSFVEDPTRIFRAVRFESRFGFSIGKLTVRLIENAIRMGVFKRLSGARAMGEIIAILEESDPVPSILRLHEFRLLAALHPAMALTETTTQLLMESRKALDGYELMAEDSNCLRWLVYFMVILTPCTSGEAREVCRILRLAKWQEDLCVRERQQADHCLKRLAKELPLDNSILYARLHVFKTEVLVYMMAAADSNRTRKAIAHFLSRLRSVRPEIQGRDLKNLGLPPGPRYKKILIQVLDAKLNGLLQTKEDETAFVARILSDTGRQNGNLELIK